MHPATACWSGGHMSLQNDPAGPRSAPKCVSTQCNSWGAACFPVPGADPTSPSSHPSPPGCPLGCTGVLFWALGLMAACASFCRRPCFRAHAGMCVPKQSPHFRSEETEAQGGRAASPGSRSLSPAPPRPAQGSPGPPLSWSPNSMASYKDTASATPTPGSQPLSQFNHWPPHCPHMDTRL